MRTLTAAALLSFFVAAGAACSGSGSAGAGEGRDDKPRAVPIEPVKLERVRRGIELVGTLAASDEVTVSSETSGKVVRIHADLGDRVRAGQVLVELDGEKLRYKLDEQRAALSRALASYGMSNPEAPRPPVEQTPDVKKASAELLQSEQAWKRADSLHKRSLVSQQQLEEAEAQYFADKAAYDSSLQNARNLAADIDASQATMRLAERELLDTSIRAPFEGYVQKRLVSPGQSVQVQTPVAMVVKLDPLKLIAEAPERMAPWVSVGQKVFVAVDAFPDRPINGVISRISPAVNQQSRSFPLEAQIPNGDGVLKPGTFARARVDSNYVEDVLTVPWAAIQNRYGINRVFIVKGDSVASIEVKLGDRVGDRVEVIEGLEAGTQIAAADVEFLVDGMKITPGAAAGAAKGTTGPPAGGER